MFGRLGEGQQYEITQSRFASARDFLMTEIVIDNGHRAGVLANMTSDECSIAETRKGRHTITFFKYKEARAGPIRVILAPRLFEWLSIFVEKFCSVITSDMGPLLQSVWHGLGRNLPILEELPMLVLHIGGKLALKGD